MSLNTSTTATLCPPQPPSKPRRARRKSAKAKPRLDYDPEVGAAVYHLLVGWRRLTLGELDDRVREVRRLAARYHFPPQICGVVDRMRARLKSGVHARSADVA